MSLVREKLMSEPFYTPYCGKEQCHAIWPRTFFNGEQFQCQCGWKSQYEKEFIDQYVAKWKDYKNEAALPLHRII